MAPSYKLIYFNTKGRAEITRMIFAAAGVEYEDCRLGKEEFQELKKSGKLPFGQLPVLEVDGKILAQSATIFKYVARETGSLGFQTMPFHSEYADKGLSPKDSFEIANADMIVDTIEDYSLKAYKFFFERDEKTKEKLTKEFYGEILPRAYEQFEKILNARGGKYFAENKMTYADIQFFTSTDMLFQQVKEDIPPMLEKYPALKSIFSAVKNNPGIKEWLKKRPVT